MKKILTYMLITAAFIGLSSSLALASGQPNASCGSDNATVMPNGFNTDGFAHAALVYAGSDGTHSAENANSSKAVSQYDVACYQLTQH